MKPSSFENLKNLSQQISDNTKGVRATHLGNNVRRPIESGIEQFNNAVRSIDKFKPRIIAESAGRGDYIYNLESIISFLPLLKQIHQTRMKELNSVTIAEASKPDYAGLVPSLGNPVDGNIGITDVRIDDKKGAPFLAQFHRIVRNAASKQASPVVVDGFMQNLLSYIRENEINLEGTLIYKIKTDYDDNKLHSTIDPAYIKRQQIQKYVDKVMQKVVCGQDSDEIAESYESLIDWAINEVSDELDSMNQKYRENPEQFKGKLNDVMHPLVDKATNPDEVTYDEVYNATLKEFQRGGATPENIALLKKLYCSAK
jgi:hypothetical protein